MVNCLGTFTIELIYLSLDWYLIDFPATLETIVKSVGNFSLCERFMQLTKSTEYKVTKNTRECV